MIYDKLTKTQTLWFSDKIFRVLIFLIGKWRLVDEEVQKRKNFLWRTLFHKTGTWTSNNWKHSDEHSSQQTLNSTRFSFTDEPQTSPRDLPETRLRCLFTPVSDRDPAPLSWKRLLPPPIDRNRSLMWEFDWQVCLKWTWHRDVTKCSTVTIFYFKPWPLRHRGISVSKPIAHIRWSCRVRRAAAVDGLFSEKNCNKRGGRLNLKASAQNFPIERQHLHLKMTSSKTTPRLCLCTRCLAYVSFKQRERIVGAGWIPSDTLEVSLTVQTRQSIGKKISVDNTVDTLTWIPLSYYCELQAISSKWCVVGLPSPHA